MTAPTPTRDEAVLNGIQISGRTLYKLDERGVNIWSANFQPNSGYSETEADKAAQAVFGALASAPAPAIGGVDAVRDALEPFAKAIIPDSDTICGWRFGTTPKHEDFVRAHEVYAVSLSPAATPVSEAGGDRFKGLMLGQNPAEVWRAQAYKLAAELDALAKPASSPAGGDVDWKSLFETAHGALICIAEAQADAHYARKVADELTDAALSQSTSAGRGE